MPSEIPAFLSSPLVYSVLSTHPNHLLSPTAPPIPLEWSSWWTWAGNVRDDSSEPFVTFGPEPRWLAILRCHERESHDAAWTDVPDEVRWLVDTARRLQVPRQRDFSALEPHMLDENSNRPARGDSTAGPREDRLHGMSPKKAHEIICMSRYISGLLSSPQLADVRHAVDVGAGQAYLSRTLRDGCGMHLLALDWSAVQSKGAARRETVAVKKRKKGPDDASDDDDDEESRKGRTRLQSNNEGADRRGSLTYETLEIRSGSLLDAVDAWTERHDVGCKHRLHDIGLGERGRSGCDPIPVLFVALHACGSLTPNVLRGYISRLKAGDGSKAWAPRAAVVIGCCYNLLEAGDFPLSRTFREPSDDSHRIALTPNHLQLAAQVPGQWLRTKETLDAAKLAIRKVVWRALLQGILEKQSASQCPSDMPPAAAELDETAIVNGETLALRRLGRLNDSAYADWETFLSSAGKRLGVQLDPALCAKDAVMESRIEVFQVLRCLLGPVVESLILLDRKQWVREELEGTGMDVRLVNLFDQASGSARNVAIVVVPASKTVT